MSKPIVDKKLKSNKTSVEAMVPKPDMTMKEFFDFFHTAYQLNQTVEAVETSESVVNQKLIEIDWSQLIQSRLVVRKEEDAEGGSQGR